MIGSRLLTRVALAALLGTVLGAATAQTQPSQSPPAPTGGSGSGTATAGASSKTVTEVGVTIDTTGGPSTLTDAVESAIQAWQAAAPDMLSVRVESKAPSVVSYATPALLGPDTLSLDTRVPGQAGVTIQISSQAVTAQPVVLLHEVGVLLGLPEGVEGVMAFAVPSSGAPQAPTPSDVSALRARLTYAPEDLNHDGRVDFYDLVLFGQAFGKQGVNLPADFNGDGSVDSSDLSLLEKAYTFTAPSDTGPPSGAPTSGATGTSSTGSGSSQSSSSP